MTFQFESPGGEERPLPYEPHLSFSERAWRRLRLLTVRCPSEIGGLGLVSETGPDFMLDDLFVVEQDVNDIATRLDQGSVHRLIIETMEQGLDPSRLRLWWHSHAKEGVFWSSEDEATIDGFRNDGMISLVTNHEMKSLARLDFYKPRLTTWVWVDAPSAAGEKNDESDAREVREIDEEIAAKLRHRPRNSPRIF